MKETKEYIEIIGKKVAMTQVFDKNNKAVPVTIVQVGPCPIVQVKTITNDGYDAVQIGFKPQKDIRLSKALKGHFEKAGAEGLSYLREFRTESPENFKVGDTINAAAFSEGQLVDVVATTKGKGTQGVVKRYGFKGGKQTHGSMSHRRGGSYGQCQWPGEVDKGKKMPGHMGDVKRTVQNLEVIQVLEEKNILLISGSFPGSTGGIVTVRTAKKIKKSQN